MTNTQYEGSVRHQMHQVHGELYDAHVLLCQAMSSMVTGSPEWCAMNQAIQEVSDMMRDIYTTYNLGPAQ